MTLLWLRCVGKKKEKTLFTIENFPIDVTLPEPSHPERPCTRIHPQYLDLGLKFSIEMFCFNPSLYNLTFTSYHIITFFDLLNKWYGENFRLQVFHMLYTMWRSSGTINSFNLGPGAYIANLTRNDNDWYKDVLVVVETGRAISLGLVWNTPSINLQFDNNGKNYGLCSRS
ncbi:hypothetical protein DVH24_018710 [Malus domestica]|uniref:Uncharacterized protein n=1 Tax=Malus domestica TaxID=3750 RepID=A0A498HP82_MALDO|nr:hypothetical protein DVH24_018710 [Malus domestica]